MDLIGLHWTSNGSNALEDQSVIVFKELLWIIIGGSAWESNPPRTLVAPHTGFEVRGTHQDPSASIRVHSTGVSIRKGF